MTTVGAVPEQPNSKQKSFKQRRSFGKWSDKNLMLFLKATNIIIQ